MAEENTLGSGRLTNNERLNTLSSTTDTTESSIRFTRLQRLMIGNGILILFMALVAGLGLWMSLVGGFEFIPGTVTQFSIPGTPEGWAKAHRGTPMNALMVFTVALILPGLGFTQRTQALLGWIIVGTGWANTMFYFFANFSQNRGLTFGANHFGPGTLESFLALAPAYFFGVLSMAGLIWMARKAFQKE
ncbi:styrene-oxide isomerase StyC [Polaromonas hydrogenivorans]|uniref:Styrene-oxide isomerase StyC n=1 Tax=Polaromonas hydrogenivorans TaxID=335476 RepID=A0AAU7LZ66_9BURK